MGSPSDLLIFLTQSSTHCIHSVFSGTRALYYVHERLVVNRLRSKMPSLYDVLVTGSAGHLGTALMLNLPSLGFKPLGVDILPFPTTMLVVM